MIPSIGLRAKLRKKCRSVANVCRIKSFYFFYLYPFSHDYCVVNTTIITVTQVDKVDTDGEGSVIGVVNADGSVTIVEETVRNETAPENTPIDVNDNDDGNGVFVEREKKRKFRSLDCDVNEVLQNDAVGKTILQISKHAKDLTTQCQGYLCDILVTYFLNKNLT